MAFHRDDFYTNVTSFMSPTEGNPNYSGIKLINNRGAASHFPDITLHASKDLYTADQDNIPIRELRTRTDYLFERGGWHSSAIGGLGLTVSSSLQRGKFNSEPNIFKRLDVAASSLPTVIRHPTVIEVGGYGSLNELHLRDIHCTAGGSLEIINRNYSDFYGASSTVITGHADNTFTVSSLDASNGWKDASCINTCAVVLSGAMDDARLTKLYSLTTARGWTSSQKDRSMYVTVQRNAELTKRATANSWLLPTYENTGSAGDLVHDISILDMTKDSMTANHSQAAIPVEVKRPGLTLGGGDPETSESNVTGFMTGNYLEKINIQNCTGPIFIRNFVVDGERSRDVGIEIDNANGVYLENCGAIRCTKAGIQINNSDITATRRLFAYRNYSTNVKENHDAAGIKMINSNLNFSGVFVGSGADMQNNNDVSIQDMIVNSCRNANGVIMHNSTITGGHSRDVNDFSNASGASFFESHLNFMDGMLLKNSTVDLSGAVDLYGNNRGLVADSSILRTDEFFVDHSQREGVKLSKSNFTYNKNLRPVTSYPATNTQGSKSPHSGLKAQTNFYRNGQHLVLDNGSSFKPEEHQLVGQGGLSHIAASSMASAMGYIRMVHPMGVTVSGDVGSHRPAVEILNGSVARFVHLFAERTHSNASLDGTIGSNAVYGDLLSVRGGSKALVQGSKNSATAILGPSGAGDATRAYHQQKHLAGVYAGDNSVIEFNGPTVVARFGVGCLAENGSTLKFNPHRQNDGSLDLSGFELSGLHNHTAIEIQAFRGCLIADKNSNIIMEDLGDYAANTGVNPANYTYNTSSMETSSYTRAGSMQFYPNPNVIGSTQSSGNDGILAGTINPPTFTSATLTVGGTGEHGQTLPGNTEGDVVTYNHGMFNPFAAKNITHMTKGGMCVRALNNSNVVVKNVHFLTGYGNDGGHLGGCSGIFYDEAGGADKSRHLNIWNLDNTSRLKATYCTVSGMDGSGTLYHGPSSVYASGSTAGTSDGKASPDDGTRLSPEAAYGAPSGTPDTGHLSVLDAFGVAPVDAFAFLSFEGGGGNVMYGNSLNSPFDRVFSSSGTAKLADASALGVTFRESGGDDIKYKYGKSDFENFGPFRLYVSPDPSCKLLMSSPSGYIAPTSGTDPDLADAVYGLAYQAYAQGYNFSSILQARSKIAGGVDVSSAYPNLLKPVPNYHDITDTKFGPIATSGFYYCKEFVDDNPDQIILDEFAANIFANSKNFSLGQSGRPKRVTLIRSLNIDKMGGETDTSTNTNRGKGFGSAGTFDLRSID